MSDIIEKPIQFTYCPKQGTKSEPIGRKNPANARLYRNWEYPFHRTYYGPGSDEKLLLQFTFNTSQLGCQYTDKL